MEFAISYIQRNCNSPIELTVEKWNKKAIHLYKSLGFEVAKETTVEGVSTKDINGNWTFSFCVFFFGRRTSGLKICEEKCDGI